MVLLRTSIRGDKKISNELMTFLRAMERADLFVVCGSGGFEDDCRDWNLSTLNTLETAIRYNIPTAMFGQGIGPLNDVDVLARMKKIFPMVKLITLRGGWGSLALLDSLGIDTTHIMTTGDEAIELAFDARQQEPGQGLGINLRVASYTHIKNDLIERIRPTLQNFAKDRNAPMIPVPIAFHPWASDHLTIQKLLKGFDDQSDGGLSLDTPLKVIKQIGRCRVVVTGAYHAAVFALAQGIPVVCLANSPNYVTKFLGLEDLFGLGCKTVFLNEPDISDKLTAAMENAWNSAETVRISLQQDALRQIKLSRDAYFRVSEILSS
jgi:colanic acid/amylovoran biosynthesis protein